MAPILALLLAVVASPQPAPEPTPPPQSSPPPVLAGPRSLAIQPDRRRLAIAARDGFRTRVACHGGCSKVELRVYISRLTAKNLGLGEYDGDVEVGGAPALTDAEGRSATIVSFRRALRKRLARARRLPIAIEAVATDPDGQTRFVLKRLTLRR
jgi:hypothetical protein